MISGEDERLRQFLVAGFDLVESFKHSRWSFVVGRWPIALGRLVAQRVESDRSARDQLLLRRPRAAASLPWINIVILLQSTTESAIPRASLERETRNAKTLYRNDGPCLPRCCSARTPRRGESADSTHKAHVWESQPCSCKCQPPASWLPATPSNPEKTIRTCATSGSHLTASSVRLYVMSGQKGVGLANDQ